MLHPRRARAANLLLVALAFVLLLSGLLLAAGGGRATQYPTLKATITGPTLLGTSSSATYALSATGGPAVGFNGTQIGTLSFSSTLAGANTTNVLLTPAAGVFVNGSASLSLTTSNLTETLVISVEVTSHYKTTNSTTNLTYSVHVIRPYSLVATIVNESPYGSAPFNLSVYLDGTLVGEVHVPGMLGQGTAQVTYNYVSSSLPSGWHVFNVSLAQEHGLIEFASGAEHYSVSFYVTGPAPDYSFYYVTGAAAFVGAIFIWLTAVGARRRRRKR
ncbi:MAG: hypothetical protein L3K13_05865 [Thermoplasmata archaeon]|nr:hypothetical protein [Thermoplasmata archaeon]